MFKLKAASLAGTEKAAELQLEIMKTIDSGSDEQARMYVWYLSVFLYEYIKYTSSFNKACKGDYSSHHQLPNLVYKMENGKEDSLNLRPFKSCKEAIDVMLADFTSDVMFMTYPHYTLFVTGDIEPSIMEEKLAELIDSQNLAEPQNPEEHQEIIRSSLAKSLGMADNELEVIKLISSTVVISGVPIFTLSSSEKFWNYSVDIVAKTEVDRGIEDILGLFANHPNVMPKYMQGDDKNYEDCDWFLDRATGVHYLSVEQFYEQYFKKFETLPQA